MNFRYWTLYYFLHRRLLIHFALVLSAICLFFSQLVECMCVFFGTFILLLAGAKKVRISRHQFHTHTRSHVRSQQQNKSVLAFNFLTVVFFTSSVVYFGSGKASARLHLLASIVQTKRYAEDQHFEKMGIVRTSYRLTLSIRQWTTFVPFPTHNQTNQRTNEHREHNRSHTRTFESRTEKKSKREKNLV